MATELDYEVPMLLFMGKRRLGLLAILAFTVLPACGTMNGARWAYGASSCYAKPDVDSNEGYIRAIVGVPVILGGVAFDAVTFPVQALFGVWPMWGDASTIGKPSR